MLLTLKALDDASVQTGRLPVHVTLALTNPETPSTGIPRNMTGLPAMLKSGGVDWSAHLVGKWCESPSPTTPGWFS